MLDKKEIKKILVIRPDAIGDCVLITPAITALKKHFPDAQITVLANALTRDLFTSNPHVSDVMLDLFRSPRQVSFWDYIKLVRSKNFDLSVHFFNELPYAALAFLAGIKYRLGDPSKPLFAWLYNLKAFQNWRDITKHEVEQNLSLLKPLRITEPQPRLEVFVDQVALGKVDALLGKASMGKNIPFACIHFSTGKGNKPWQAEKFGEVARYLIEEKSLPVIATGLSSDLENIAKAQVVAKQKIINLAGQTSLQELIALISRCSMFIGVDTGPFHIAAALQRPMVAIFTSNFVLPSKWAPYGTKHVIVKANTSCKIFCRPQTCKINTCVNELSAEEVIRAADRLLAFTTEQTIEEARLDWCKKSFHIMVSYTDKNIARAQTIESTLQLAGFNVVLMDLDKDSRFIRFFKNYNINILHMVDSSAALKTAAFLSGLFLPLPVLCVKDQPDLRKDSDFFEFYRKQFEAVSG